MTKVYLPVICYNHTVLSHFMFSIMRLVMEGQRRGISFSMDCIYFESLIARARNAAAANFLGQKDSDYIIFIDSDISFEPESFFRLLNSDKDLFSGLYPKKYISSTKLKLLSDKGPELLHNYEPLCTDFATEIPFNKNVSEIEEVKYAATGFMLFKKRVFNQMVHYLARANAQHSFDATAFKTLLDISRFSLDERNKISAIKALGDIIGRNESKQAKQSNTNININLDAIVRNTESSPFKGF